ncbi:hypothetical protein [Acidilobus sp.]|uniref:hypothetical protein n=1 Tax=Acidilobus sp. TaxID=1872109 RepID=UPI003D06E1E2
MATGVQVLCQTCNQGLYVKYYYSAAVYYAYVVCPNFPLIQSQAQEFASNSTVIVDTNIGYLAISR